MSKFDSIDYVMSLTPMGMKEGKENVLKLMQILWNPQDTLRVFHVTGSNGKWSTCQMISQVLWKNFWKKIWLFTSPHFVDINERFQINGKTISHSALEKYYEEVINLSEINDIPLSFFEIQVVAMVLYFVAEKVDYAVIEVGLGGTYDGTNIFTHPLACFITSITLEHTHVLWKTRASILKNKLWIIKYGTQLYTPIKNKLIEESCKKNWVKLRSLKKPQKTNLPGKHQEKNAGLVFQALRDAWFDKIGIEKWLMNIDNPWRFEWITSTILVDTANNRENIGILKKMVREQVKKKKIIILFGSTQADASCAGELAREINWDQKILIDDFCDRSLPCVEYEKQVPHDEIIHLFHEEEKLMKILKNDDSIKVIYWSFYLVGEIMKLSIYKPFAKD